METTKAAYEAATEKAEAAQSAYEETLTDAQLENYEPEEISLPEEEVFLAANAKYEAAKAAFENFSKRPKKTRIERPDLTISDTERSVQVKRGKNLYRNTYGCNRTPQPVARQTLEPLPPRGLYLRTARW
jgi:hypothetical protein